MTGKLLDHVAIADDWESSVAIGSQEAATHGCSLDEVGYDHAIKAEAIQHVLDSEYVHDILPLVLVVLDSDAIDVPVDWDPPDRPRVLGPIPAGDPTAVVAVTPLIRLEGRWLAPAEPGGFPETVLVQQVQAGTAPGEERSLPQNGVCRRTEWRGSRCSVSGRVDRRRGTAFRTRSGVDRARCPSLREG